MCPQSSTKEGVFSEYNVKFDSDHVRLYRQTLSDDVAYRKGLDFENLLDQFIFYISHAKIRKPQNKHVFRRYTAILKIFLVSKWRLG